MQVKRKRATALRLAKWIPVEKVLYGISGTDYKRSAIPWDNALFIDWSNIDFEIALAAGRMQKPLTVKAQEKARFAVKQGFQSENAVKDFCEHHEKQPSACRAF
jgi:hypothetical protein